MIKRLIASEISVAILWTSGNTQNYASPPIPAKRSILALPVLSRRSRAEGWGGFRFNKINGIVSKYGNLTNHVTLIYAIFI